MTGLALKLRFPDFRSRVPPAPPRKWGKGGKVGGEAGGEGDAGVTGGGRGRGRAGPRPAQRRAAFVTLGRGHSADSRPRAKPVSTPHVSPVVRGSLGPKRRDPQPPGAGQGRPSLPATAGPQAESGGGASAGPGEASQRVLIALFFAESSATAASGCPRPRTRLLSFSQPAMNLFQVSK